MSRKKETITLSIPPGTKEKLEELARRFGIFWGQAPSPSGLIAAIAEHKLEVGEAFSLDSSQVKALEQAIALLTDTGKVGEAKTLTSLILDKGKLETPLRQKLLAKSSQHDRTLRPTLESYINNRQPFTLLYANSQGAQLEFTVHYAEITFYEKRFYVNIWCEETDDVSEQDRKDFPELIHNRCLRLDRIEAIVDRGGEWRSGLDYIKVQLQLTGGLVRAYEPRDGDIKDERFENHRTITRKVSNPFWFIREIIVYGEDCYVITPVAMRQRIQRKLQNLCNIYGDK